VPAHIIDQPIIQRNKARGNNNSLISRLRILVFHLSSFYLDGCVVFQKGYSFYEVVICIGGGFCVVLYILMVFWALLSCFRVWVWFVMCICVGSVDNKIY
jgi:hypothetical protein